MSRVLSPSTSPRSPLQNPSRIQANVVANGEIGIIFFHSGQPPPPPLNPLSRIDGRVELSLLPCRFCRRRADPGVTVAIQASSANGRPRVSSKNPIASHACLTAAVQVLGRAAIVDPKHTAAAELILWLLPRFKARPRVVKTSSG